MRQLRDFADSRLLNGCIYCGGTPETREHVPSRGLLDSPYRENLPVVGSCKGCNEGFSDDEQYLICLLEVTLSGSTDPQRIGRASVSRALSRAPALRAKLESSKRIVGDRTLFETEKTRVENVLVKLAKGHAAFELSQPCRSNPSSIWYAPLELFSAEELETFNAPHIQQLFGEVGSRNLQRAAATVVSLESETGEKLDIGCMINDWIDVQSGYYRYLAIDDMNQIIIRIVIREFLACEIRWEKDA